MQIETMNVHDKIKKRVEINLESEKSTELKEFLIDHKS